MATCGIISWNLKKTYHNTTAENSDLFLDKINFLWIVTASGPLPSAAILIYYKKSYRGHVIRDPT